MLTRRELTRKMAAACAAACVTPPRVWAGGLAEPEAGDIKGVPVAYRRIPVDLIPRLESDMKRVIERAGVSDHHTYRTYIHARVYRAPEKLPEARSVVLLAIADHSFELDVLVDGRTLTVPIPPGYTSDDLTDDDQRAFVRTRVLRNGAAKLEPANLPLKLLAARSGLAEYGRNNITYVRGMGSFHRLVAYFTDQACPATPWRSVRPMRHCKGCTICLDLCPTNAIRPDRFVIDAGRCVTLHNEVPDPMPAWIPATAHNALVGCTLCQWKCPANARALAGLEKLASLTEAETAMLLTGTIDVQLGQTVATKLARNGLGSDLKHLARNLRLVVRP